jgi:hypothetical protein
MISSSTDDSDIDSVSFVPTSISVDNIYAISRVKIVDSTFSVDLPYLFQNMLAMSSFQIVLSTHSRRRHRQ